MRGRRATLLETARKYGKFSNLLHDVIIHDIDMFNLMSPSEPCQAYCVRVKKACRELGVDDAYLGIVGYRNGAAASFETSWVLPTSNPHWLDARLHIEGTTGAIYIDLQSHGLEVVEDVKLSRPDISNCPVVGGRLMGNLRELVNHFADCVTADKEPWPGGADTRKALASVLALLESAESERPVALG